MGIKKKPIPKTPLSDRPTVNNTDGLKFEREITAVSGSTGSGDVDLGPIWFSRNPSIVYANTSGVSVKATVGIDTDVYASSSQWWGIWETAASPSDAEVKAGTGALATGSGSYAHLAAVTDTLSSVSLTVNTAYTLHWFAEAGAAETLVSVRAPGVTFTVANSPPIGKPSINGEVKVNEILTCDTSGISDFDTIATPFTCYWYASGVEFDSPAEGVLTTTLTEAEKNKTIVVAVTYTDGNGIFEGPIESSGYGPVQAINYAPTGSLVITGNPTVDQWLTASQGTFDDANGYFTATATVHWRYGDAGQEYIGTGNPYQVQSADIGRTLQAGVSYIDGDNFTEPPTGIAHWDSTPTAVVGSQNHAPTGLLSISGDTYQVPQWVQAEQGTLADANGLPDLDDDAKWQWQWQWNSGESIAGATSRQYQLQNSDGGKRLKISAVYIDDDGYSNNAESQSTPPISAAPPTGEFFHDFSTYFMQDGLGPFGFTRANSDSCADYMASQQAVSADIPLMPGDRWDGSTWQNESVGYGVELKPGATVDDVGDLQAPLANLPGLPVEGLTDNYAVQLTLTLRDDLANFPATGYFFEAGNVAGGSPGDQAIRAYASPAGAVVEVVVDATPYTLTYAEAAVTGAQTYQRFDVRASKDGAGLTAWLYVDSVLVAKKTDAGATAPHAVAIDKIDIGSQIDDTAIFTRGVPPATLAPAEYQLIRIEPDTTTLTDTDIEGWSTWQEPAPVLDPTTPVDPPYLHFGTDPQTVPVATISPGPFFGTAGGGPAVFYSEFDSANTVTWQQSPTGSGSWTSASTIPNSTGVNSNEFRVDPTTAGISLYLRCEGYNEIGPGYAPATGGVEFVVNATTPDAITEFGDIDGMYGYWSLDANLNYDQLDYTYITYDWTSRSLSEVKPLEGAVESLLPVGTVGHTNVDYWCENMRACRPNGANSSLLLTYGAGPSTSAGMSVFMIYRLDYEDGGTALDILKSGGTSHIAVTAGSGPGATYLISVEGGGPQDTELAAVDNETVALALVFDDTTAVLYVDGVAAPQSIDMTNATTATIGKVACGNDGAATPSTGIQGVIGGVAIYHKALVLTDIQSASSLCDVKSFQGVEYLRR